MPRGRRRRGDSDSGEERGRTRGGGCLILKPPPGDEFLFRPSSSSSSLLLPPLEVEGERVRPNSIAKTKRKKNFDGRIPANPNFDILSRNSIPRDLLCVLRRW